MPDIIYIDLLDAFNKSRLTSHMYMYLDIAKTNPISSHSEYTMNPQSIRAVDRMRCGHVCAILDDFNKYLNTYEKLVIFM
jgi:hypothetical protein